MNTSNHPFTYFTELIEKQSSISDFRHAFYLEWEQYPHIVDFQKDAVIVEGRDGEERYSVLDDLKKHIENEKIQTSIAIDKVLIEIKNEKEKEVVIKTILQNINGLISSLSKRPDLTILEFVEGALMNIKISFQEKYCSNSNEPRHKIKWLGQKKQLVTLFFDLWQGQEKSDKKKQSQKLAPLIASSKNDLKEFILTNFTDTDGNALSTFTVDEILTRSESKDVSRAQSGSRIELEY